MATGFLIVVDTLCQGNTVAIRAQKGDEPEYCPLWATELDATKEMAENMVSRLQAFIDWSSNVADFDCDCDEMVVKVECEPGAGKFEYEGRLYPWNGVLERYER